MSAMGEMTEEELLTAYEDVIKKAGMMRYLLSTEHGIQDEPLQKAWALVSRADYEMIKRRKVMCLQGLQCRARHTCSPCCALRLALECL